MCRNCAHNCSSELQARMKCLELFDTASRTCVDTRKAILSYKLCTNTLTNTWCMLLRLSSLAIRSEIKRKTMQFCVKIVTIQMYIHQISPKLCWLVSYLMQVFQALVKLYKYISWCRYILENISMTTSPCTENINIQ